MTNTRAFWLAIGLILIFCLATRLTALQHGLPHLQIVDENSDLSTALRLIEGEIPERHVRYHRSLITYLDAASVGGLFGVGYLTGSVDGVEDFRNLYFTDRALFTVATRSTIAGLTIIAVLLVGLTGRYINEWVGILAAGILAVNGFFLLNSVYALPDALGMSAAAVCLWLAVRLWHSHRRRDYFLAGVGLAIIMLSKFNGLPVGIGVVVAHTAIVMNNHPNVNRTTLVKAWLVNWNLAWLVGGIVIGNLVLNPLPFFYPADLIWEIQNLRAHAYGSGSVSLEHRLQLIGMHITDAVMVMWRWLIPASALGLATALNDRRKVDYWVIISAFVAIFVAIANVTSVHYKIFFWTPWLIPMSLLSAIGLDRLRRWASARGWQVLAYAVIGVIFSLESVFFFQIFGLMRAGDTRNLARDYVTEQMPPHTRIVTGDPLVYSIPLQRSETSIARAQELGGPDLLSWEWWLSQPEAQRPGPAYDLFGPEMQAVVDTFGDLEQLIQDETIAYVIEADYCYGTQNRPDSTSGGEYPALDSGMRARWTLVAVFSPYATEECLAELEPRTALALYNAGALVQQMRSGPLIRIYQTSSREEQTTR